MDNKKETTLEGSVQEQSSNKYPTKLELRSSLISKDQFYQGNLIHSDSAIKLTLEINSNLYTKEDVRKEVKATCQKLLEYFY